MLYKPILILHDLLVRVYDVIKIKLQRNDEFMNWSQVTVALMMKYDEM
jgi:hypothetical protein